LKDVANQELEVGDRVVYQNGGRHPGLRVATIKGFTPKMVRTNLGTVNPYKLAKIYSQEENK